MGTIRKQSIQGTAILIIGVFLGLILKLFIFTKYLDEEQVGLLAVLLDAANIFAAFIPLGSPAIFMRFLPFFKDTKEQKPRGLMFLGVSLSAIGFCIFLILFFSFYEPLKDFYSVRAPLFSKYIYYLVPLVFARVIFIITSEYSSAVKKNIFPMMMKEIVVRLLTGITIILFAADYFNFDGLVFWFVVIYYISGTLMLIYLKSRGHLDIIPARENYDTTRMKEILYFGLFAIFSSSAGILVRNIDSIFITSMVNLGDAGIYSIAFLIGTLIEMPRRALSQITAPFIADASAKNKTDLIADLYHRSAINQFIVGSITLLCIWTSIDSLFMIIENGDVYARGKYVVLFIGLGKLFDMSMGVNSQIIQNSPYYRFNFYSIGLLAILSISTNLLLIPVYGMIGAAIASMVTMVVVNIIRAIFIKVKMGITPFEKSNYIALFLLVATYVILYVIPDFENPWINIVVNTILVVFIFGGISLSLKLSKDLNDMALRVRKRFLS